MWNADFERFEQDYRSKSQKKDEGQAAGPQMQ